MHGQGGHNSGPAAPKLLLRRRSEDGGKAKSRIGKEPGNPKMFFEVILKKGQNSKQIDRERKMTNARHERKAVTTDPRAIKRITR